MILLQHLPNSISLSLPPTGSRKKELANRYRANFDSGQQQLFDLAPLPIELPYYSYTTSLTYAPYLSYGRLIYVWLLDQLPDSQHSQADLESHLESHLLTDLLGGTNYSGRASEYDSVI